MSWKNSWRDIAFVIERIFDAPRDLVWKVYTDAEHLKNCSNCCVHQRADRPAISSQMRWLGFPESYRATWKPFKMLVGMIIAFQPGKMVFNPLINMVDFAMEMGHFQLCLQIHFIIQIGFQAVL